MRVEYTSIDEFLSDLGPEAQDGTRAVRVTVVEQRKEQGLIDVLLVATYFNTENDLCELAHWCGQDVEFSGHRTREGSDVAKSHREELAERIRQMGFGVQGGRFSDA